MRAPNVLSSGLGSWFTAEHGPNSSRRSYASAMLRRLLPTRMSLLAVSLFLYLLLLIGNFRSVLSVVDSSQELIKIMGGIRFLCNYRVQGRSCNIIHPTSDILYQTEYQIYPNVQMYYSSVSSLYNTLEQYRGKIKKLDYENLRRQEDIKSIISDPGKKLTENDKNFLALQQVKLALRTSDGNFRFEASITLYITVWIEQCTLFTSLFLISANAILLCIITLVY